MDNLQEAVAMTALNHMFKKGHFDICTIDAVAKVMNVNPGGREYVMLRALHCIDYKDIPKEVYESLPGMIRRCLSISDVYEFDHEFLRQKKIMVSPVQRIMRIIQGA